MQAPMPEFGASFYIVAALLVAMLVLLWRWYLKKPTRTGTDTFFVVVISAIGLAPLLFVGYVLFLSRSAGG